MAVNIVLLWTFFRRRASINQIKDQNPEGFSQRCQAHCCFRYFNGFLKFIHFLFWGFLSAGAIISASAVQYRARGTVYALKQTDGRSVDIHVYCQGPRNASLPVIWIVADAAHGVVDFYGLQQYLVAQNRRVCTQDNPAFGWSSDMLKQQEDYAGLFYDAMFEASGEGFPIILAPWGGGGSVVAKYAKRRPERVKAVVMLSVFSPGIEFQTYQAQNDLSASQLENYRRVQMMGRQMLAKIILGLAAPWGLLPIFVPLTSVSQGYEPKDRITEFRVQLWTHRMWVGQMWFIKSMAIAKDEDDPLSTMPFAPNITVAHLLCRLNDTQVCLPKGSFTPSAQECTDRKFSNKFMFDRQLWMTFNLSSTAKVIYNQDDDCALDMPVHKPAWTAQALLQAVGDITLP